ncbi:MAG TPA: protein kinase [Polyangiaceae bacterium]
MATEKVTLARDGGTPVAALESSLIAERYRVATELGRGGMGAVYRVRDEVTGDVLAFKKLEATAPEALERFEREYRILASLDHPRVIEVFDFGHLEDGGRYYTMECLEGRDLYALSPVPWRKLCEYLRDIATSLLLLHARKLVHRDVSPRNVRFDSNGRAKLIDFGALASFGIATEIIGTPVCTAPEVLRQGTLDQRTDLFSLGVIGYWALTQRKPYAISDFREAEGAWSSAPIAPARLVPEIPKALDALLLSLLSADPSGRPASAAEVIDRLTAIAELDDDTLAGVAESHLLSSELVGCDHEKNQLTQHLERASRGQGGVVVLEGASGSGRTRLATELAIHARVVGLTAVSVDAKLFRGSLGAIRALMRALLDAAPGSARRALSAHPELARVLETDDAEHATASPGTTEFIGSGEKRARISSAFVSWVLEIAESRPLFLFIDDAHFADTFSAGALIGLAHAVRRARILFLATVSQAGDAPAGVRQLIRIGARIKLRGLELSAVEKLVSSVVGDVPHRTRLCRWLYETSDGNPRQVIDLLGELVRRGTVRYENGAWVLPATLSDQALPASISEVLATRIEQLGGGALRLSALLALHRGVVSDALCQRLVPVPSEAHSLLDELVARRIVARSGRYLRLVHEPLRALLLDRVTAKELPSLHVTLGNALLADISTLDVSGESQLGTSQLCVMLQAGWHLLHGGEEARGRELLRRAGLELTQRGEGLPEVVPALEAALEAYRRQGRSRFECGHLLIPLTLAGNWMDWRLSYRYGDELFEILADATGIALAKRLARVLPKKLALGVALAFAVVAQAVSARGLIARNFRDSLLMLIGLTSAMLGTCATLLDSARAQRLLRLLEPMQWFPASHPVRVTHELQLALADCAGGRYAECWARAQRALDQLRRPGGVAGIPESARQQLETGVLLLLASIDCYRLDGTVHRTLSALEIHGTAAAREAAVSIRANYHAGRGERAELERFREEIDVLAAQGGTTWRSDVLIPRNLWWCYALWEDVLGLKRMVAQLQVVGSDHAGLAATRDAAHACYLAERGMAAQALERYEAMFEAEIRPPNAIAMRFVGAYARILRATGQPLRAKAVCEDALRRQSPESLAFECLSYSTRLELALAVAELGQPAEALDTLQALLSAQQAHDNPLIHGLTHKAIALVSLMQRDRETFIDHLWRMQDWFEKTENPALMAQCQRLTAEGRAAGLLEVSAEAQRDAQREGEAVKVAAAFSGCRGPAARLQTALDLLVQQAQASHGYLYLMEPGGLRFAAPAVGFEPPEALLEELGRRVSELCDDDVETVIVTATSLSSPSAERNDYRTVLLTLLRTGELVVIGVVALFTGDEPLELLSSAFVEEVARGIYDSGDVRTVYFQRSSAYPSQHPRGDVVIEG